MKSVDSRYFSISSSMRWECRFGLADLRGARRFEPFEKCVGWMGTTGAVRSIGSLSDEVVSAKFRIIVAIRDRTTKKRRSK